MTARDSDGDTATLTFNWTATLPAGTGTVLSVSPNPPASANYTVSGAYTDTKSYIYFTLFETNPRGQVTRFHHASVPFRQSIANRVDGAYTYRLEGCYLKQYQNYPEAYEVCENVGDTLAVTVDGPDPDSVSTQLGYTFQARKGDINGDSRMDLLIDRTSTATGGGVFQDVILQQTANGAFELVAPNASQTTTSSGWPTASVDLVLGDINLDGFVDVLVRGLASAIGVTGVLDQIVYAPGRTGGSPVILNAVDSSLTNFLTEVSSWTQNPMYFQQQTTTEKVQVFVERLNCFVDEGRRFCIAYPVLDIEYTRTVPTNKSSEAREFAQQFSLVDGRINPDVTLGSQRARNLSGILQRVFGTEILNGQLESACTGFFDYDSITRIPCVQPNIVGRIVLAQVQQPAVVFLYNYDDSPNNTQPNQTDLYQYRTLTTSEQQLATDNGLEIENLATVRIYHASRRDPRLRGDVNAWFVDRGHIHVPQYVLLEGMRSNLHFEEEFTSVQKKGILIHELAHVWQDRNEGVVEVIVRDPKPSDYHYRQTGGTLITKPDGTVKSFRDFTNEQQAEILEDRYLLQHNGSMYMWDANKKPNTTDKAMLAELNAIPGIPDFLYTMP